MEQLSTKFWEISQTAYAHGSPWTAEQFASDIKQAHSHYFTEGTEIIAFWDFIKSVMKLKSQILQYNQKDKVMEKDY